MVQKSSILQKMVIIYKKPLMSYNGPLIGHDPIGPPDSLQHIFKEKRNQSEIERFFLFY